MKLNLYSTLGVKPKATTEEIKKAYRKIAMENHPDKNPNNKAAAKKMLEANEAYEILSNSEKKKAYDDALLRYLKAEIEREKTKETRRERTRSTKKKSSDNQRSSTETEASFSIQQTVKNAAKSILVGVLRTILRR